MLGRPLSRAGRALIRRRHVFYVAGYDPQGAKGYYGLFRREWKRFLTLWPVKAELGELAIDSDDIAHWDVKAAGPNWEVETRYEFMRQEALIRSNLAQPIARQIGRSVRWMLDYLASGALLRIFRVSWRFGLVLVYFQALLMLWVGIAVVGAGLGALGSMHLFHLPGPVALFVGVAIGLAAFAALRPLAQRMFVIRINNHWPYLSEFARGNPSGFDRPIEACAQRLVARARAGEVDEIVVIGHSGGGVISPFVLTRALELDPDLGRHGPRIVLLTLGSIMPGVALHPAAVKMRAAIARLAVEPSIWWIDCQARKDVMNFWDFDPVAGVGVDIGSRRVNPLVWIVRYRDMIALERYRRVARNFFRAHFQFIMANDIRAPYDYFMLVCGPAAIADRQHGMNLWACFSENATYVAEASAPVAVRSRPSRMPVR